MGQWWKGLVMIIRLSCFLEWWKSANIDWSDDCIIFFNLKSHWSSSKCKNCMSGLNPKVFSQTFLGKNKRVREQQKAVKRLSCRFSCFVSLSKSHTLLVLQFCLPFGLRYKLLNSKAYSFNFGGKWPDYSCQQILRHCDCSYSIAPEITTI